MFTRILMPLMLVLSIGLFVGCGGEEASEEPMTELVEGLATEISNLESMSATHQTTVEETADLPAVLTEEAAYKNMMLGHHETMHHQMDEMGSCQHEGTAPHTEDLDTGLDDLNTEINLHATNMAGAADLAEAVAEETRYQTALAVVISSLNDHHAELATDPGDFMCVHDDAEAAHGDEH